MKRISRATGFVLCFVGFVTTVSSQAREAADVKAIDAYARTVDTIRKKRKQAELIFADTSNINAEQEKWRVFASERVLEKFRKTNETYSIAYSWRKGGKIVASNFTLFSPSGDWVKYVYHYFRADGTLARVESDYRTFNGDFMVVRRRHFEPGGKQIKQTAQFLDLKTRKPKDASSGVMGDSPDEVDYYLAVSKLPFAHLIKE